MSVYPNSTRQFIQKTANLVSIAPILIREDRSIALLFDGDTPYKFEIFHLIFIVTKSGICVKSYLADDNMIHYTNLLDLDKIKLQHVLCILTSNISAMEANAYNDDLFATVYNHIKKLIVQVKDRIGYEPFIVTPYFQIGVTNIGLVFKQLHRGMSADYVVGRHIVTMGQFNIALLGLIHDELMVDNGDKAKQQKGFAITHRLSGFIRPNLQDTTYDQYVDWLKNMDILNLKTLIHENFMPYVNDTCVCDSLLEYATEPRTGSRPTHAINRKVSVDLKTQKITVVDSDGGHDGNTDLSTYKGKIMSPTEKVLNQRRNINTLLLRQKWSLTSIFGADNKVIVADKTTINIQALLNTADIEDKFLVKSRDLCFYPTPRVDFVNKNIDLYCVAEGGEYYVYFEGKLVFTLANLETALNVLIDEDAYIKLFRLDMSNNSKEESCTFQSDTMVKLHDKLSSIAWSQYSYNLIDYGVKKVVRIKELLACQDMVTHVCQVLESQTVSRKDIFEFLEQELTIYMTNDQTMRISYPFKDGTLPIVYFVSWNPLLEWLTKIGNYVLVRNAIKMAEQAAATAVVEFPSTNSSQVGLSQQDSIQKNISLTEAFLEKEIPQLSDNFTLRIDFDQFLKQTQRHQYVHHKLDQERLILKDKSFPSIYRTPSFLRIVLSDESRLDTEKNKTIVTKSCVVEFVYNESTVTKKAVLDFRMFKFNEYKKSDFIAALARYLENTASIISSIVSHWKYIDNKQESSKEQKIAKLKDAIWKYLDTRCFESKLMVGQPPKVTEVHDTYLFDPAKFVEYFNQCHGKHFKIMMQTASLAVSVTIKRSGSNSYRYEILGRDNDTVSYVFDNRDAAIHHLLYFVKF